MYVILMSFFLLSSENFIFLNFVQSIGCFQVLFLGCFASGLRAFLLNFFCYDLKVFLCGHYNEQVISLTDTQIC